MGQLKVFILVSIPGFFSSPLMAAQNLWDLSLEELGNIEVTNLATGSPTPLNRAAAITTVITSSDLINMGAQSIDDALMTVPGLYVSRSDQAYAPMYIFRGIYGNLNPQALLMVNGIPHKVLPFGNRGNGWKGVPVEAIDRIEVIRGPGSALYGADAFAGVINIITKTSQEAEGIQVGVRAGSFNSQDAWVQYGGQAAEWDVFFNAHISTTDGHKASIESDTQTLFDGLAQILDPDPNYDPASRAPGHMNTGYKSLDLNVDVSRNEWRFRAGYQNVDDMGLGVGVADALSPESFYSTESANFDVSYTQDIWDQDLNLVSEFSVLYDEQAAAGDTKVFPDGAKVPDVCTITLTCLPTFYEFPDGFIGNPGYKEIQARLTQYAVYTGWDEHRVRVALGVTWGDVYKTTETKNFNTNNSPKAAGIVDVSDTDEVWLPEKTRDSYFVSVQDEWQIARDWQLVAGARYDKYSDFGDTTNPRLALVWLTSDDWTTRLMYGRAYRAPSLSELYATANPVALGDTNLEPEVIDTYELAFHRSFDGGSHYSLNFFHYRIEDLILLTGQQFTNIGERKGKGLEFEFESKLTTDLTLVGNYSYQKSEDLATNEDVGNAPTRQGYLSLNWASSAEWNVNVEGHWLGTIERPPGDARDPIGSESVWNITARRMGLVEGLEVAVSVRNMFDSDWRTPSATSVPGDYPAPGRSGNVSVSYKL